MSPAWKSTRLTKLEVERVKRVSMPASGMMYEKRFATLGVVG